MSADATPVSARPGPIRDAEFAVCQRMLNEGKYFATKAPLEGEAAWEPVGGLRLVGGKEEHGFMRLWRRRLGSNFIRGEESSKRKGNEFEYFACGEIAGTDAATMFAVCQDREYRMAWDPRAKAIERLEKYQDGCECLYWLVKMRLPLWNRDYVFYRRSHHDVQSGIFCQVSIGGKHSSKPPLKKRVRVDTYMNKMAMRQKGAETVEFVLHCVDDLKGSIPKSVVRWAVETAIPQFVARLRQACLDYPHERVTLFTANHG